MVAWSVNNEAVSRKFEIGAPPFMKRFEAAKKVQKAGYPVRIRLDPIVPFEGWKEGCKDTIKQIFSKISPERITLGTLRFEEGFYKMRNTIFTTGPELPQFLEKMEPMFAPKLFEGKKRTKTGKYSFTPTQRTDIFRYVIDEIRKHSDCRIALVKNQRMYGPKQVCNYPDAAVFANSIMLRCQATKNVVESNGQNYFGPSYSLILQRG